MANNLLIVLTGKTASGKDTVMSQLLSRFPDLRRVITTTSRPPRPEEKNGVDYHFISPGQFKRKIGSGDFIEYVEYGGYLYGTEKVELSNYGNSPLIWRIDPSRAGQIKKLLERPSQTWLDRSAMVIYLTASDRVVLKRLKERELNKTEIETRMKEDAEFWNRYKDNYDFVVENVPGRLEETTEKIIKLIETASMESLKEQGVAPVALVIGITIISLMWLYISKPLAPPRLVDTNSASPVASPSLPDVPREATFASPVLSPKPVLSPIPSVATPTPTALPQVTANNTPPGAGYQHQTVTVEGQSYPVSIVAADLSSTKVIVDTASDSDCSDNCPVLSLADYVGKNGAYAGINGSFFCPADYDSCKGKTNSFDTLLMNKNKHYFNSDNNVYSNIPAAIFSVGSARFVGRSLEWGRDTGVDSVIANYPLLIAGNNVSYTENPAEPKFGQKGARTFLATKGNMVYIGVITNATMGESAKVLHALGMGEALNLDEGGSTALWHEGYKVGPGRNIPNVILFLRR